MCWFLVACIATNARCHVGTWYTVHLMEFVSWVCQKPACTVAGIQVCCSSIKHSGSAVSYVATDPFASWTRRTRRHAMHYHCSFCVCVPMCTTSLWPHSWRRMKTVTALPRHWTSFVHGTQTGQPHRSWWTSVKPKSMLSTASSQVFLSFFDMTRPLHTSV